MHIHGNVTELERPIMLAIVINLVLAALTGAAFAKVISNPTSWLARNRPVAGPILSFTIALLSSVVAGVYTIWIGANVLWVMPACIIGGMVAALFGLIVTKRYLGMYNA
jgi:hypothetical protein